MSRLRCHYMLREPGSALPLIALALNIAFVVFLIGETKAIQPNLKAGFAASASVSPKTPLLVLGARNQMRIDGRALGSPAELKAALTQASQTATVITVRTEEGASVEALSDALQRCAQCGFTKVVFEPGQTGKEY